MTTFSDITSLLENEKFNEAAQLSRQLSIKHPDVPDYLLFQGVSLLALKKYPQVVKLMTRAIDRFRDEWRFYDTLAAAHVYMDDFVQAESSFREAIRIGTSSGKDQWEVADVCCDFADLLWQMRRGPEALEVWAEALRIDPACDSARESLEECTNEYGEPRAVSPAMDDLQHFIRIQLDKFLKDPAREITQDTLPQALFDQFQRAWNEQVAPKSQELDRMTTAQKTAFFSRVTITF